MIVWTLHNNYNHVNSAGVGASVFIGGYVWLGARSIVLRGIIIDKGAVFAGAAVATRVDPYSAAIGVPAKIISQRESQKYDYSPGEDKTHVS